jgi:hypothetical protein
VREYLADLPDGPHASAALALLVAFGSDMREAELTDLARKVRNEDAKLEAAAVRRRAASEAVLATLGVLLDDDVYGVPLADAPTKLTSLLTGASTWGGLRGRFDRDFFFLLPTRPERTSRLMTLSLTMVETGGLLSGAKLEGSDLFVRWAEADQIALLDTSPEDRTEAQVHVMARLSGALERRFPKGTCPDRSRGRELYRRACDGWEVVVTPGERPGETDVILLSAPRGRTAPGR